VRLGRWATVVEALVKLALTVGGGLAAVDALWRAQLGRAVARRLVVASVLLLLQLPVCRSRCGEPSNRGALRIQPDLAAPVCVDFAKQLLLAFVLGAPMVLATLALMDRAGAWWWLWAWLIWLGVTWG
jgi:STE24 endopeptidase